MKYVYKVERISGDLEKYLNEQSNLGWRCVGVMTNTGLGWTVTVVLERPLNNEGKISKEIAEKEIRIYEFLATCDNDDLCRLVDSSAFNDLIRALLQMAVENAGIDEKSKAKVIGQLRWIFDEKSAKEVLNKGEMRC